MQDEVSCIVIMQWSTFSSSVEVFSSMVSTSNIMSSTFTSSAALWSPSSGCQGVSLPLSLFKPLCKSYQRPQAIIAVKRQICSTMVCWWPSFTFSRSSCWAHISSAGARASNIFSPKDEGLCLCSRNGASELITRVLILNNSCSQEKRRRRGRVSVGFVEEDKTSRSNNRKYWAKRTLENHPVLLTSW